MSGEYHVTKSRPASLEEETRTVIEEARMVLPGIQAVFGFQLIAVFNNGFHSLTPPEQLMHLIALVLIMIAIALIMTPASYHRIAEKGTVSSRFVNIASRLLALAMFPLMLGMIADLFLVARLVLNNMTLSIAIAAVLVFVFFGLWYLFPWSERRFIRDGSNPVGEQ
jgi:cytochrome bd-type quinol oxidase subunit 2